MSSKKADDLLTQMADRRLQIRAEGVQVFKALDYAAGLLRTRTVAMRRYLWFPVAHGHRPFP